jgi:hypothetical protein
MILNLTNLDATPKQIAAGVIEFPFDDVKNHIRFLNAFYEVPCEEELMTRANIILELTLGTIADYREQGLGEITGVMLGGEHFMVRLLEKIFIINEVKIFYPFNCDRVLCDRADLVIEKCVDAREFCGFVVTDMNKVVRIFERFAIEKEIKDLLM